MLDIPPQLTLSEMGLDQFGQSPLKFEGSGLNLKSQTMFEAGVPSNFIQDGDMIVRLNVIEGYLQSDNFVTGASGTGWRLSDDGIEANDGNFRGDITAATGLFGGTIGFENVAAGTNAKVLNVGHGNVKIDGANKRIIINDGTNDRVLIGYYAGLF